MQKKLLPCSWASTQNKGFNHDMHDGQFWLPRTVSCLNISGGTESPDRAAGWLPVAATWQLHGLKYARFDSSWPYFFSCFVALQIYQQHSGSFIKISQMSLDVVVHDSWQWNGGIVQGLLSSHFLLHCLPFTLKRQTCITLFSTQSKVKWKQRRRHGI